MFPFRPLALLDDPADVALAVVMLLGAVVAYWVIDRVRPGAGAFPPAFSAALRWLDRNAGEDRVLAWWDYAAPLRDHTDVRPVLAGPSEGLRGLIDDPGKVRRWVPEDETARVGAFFMAESPGAALEYVAADEFEYLLVARSDLEKAPAMREAARGIDGFGIDDPEAVLLRSLIEGSTEWPVAFENDQVRIYRSPEGG